MEPQKKRYNVVVADSYQGMGQALDSALQRAGAVIEGSPLVSFHLSRYDPDQAIEQGTDTVVAFLERSKDIGFIFYKTKSVAVSDAETDAESLDLVIVDDLEDPRYAWQRALADLRKVGYKNKFVLASHGMHSGGIQTTKGVSDVIEVHDVDDLLRYIVKDYDDKKAKA